MSLPTNATTPRSGPAWFAFRSLARRRTPTGPRRKCLTRGASRSGRAPVPQRSSGRAAGSRGLDSPVVAVCAGRPCCIRSSTRTRTSMRRSSRSPAQLVRDGARSVPRVLGSQAAAHLSDRRARTHGERRRDLGRMAGHSGRAARHVRHGVRGVAPACSARPRQIIAVLVARGLRSTSSRPFNLTEGFVLPAQAAALLILARWSRTPGESSSPALGVGALGGIAFMLRPNLIGTPAAVAIAMALALLITRRVRDVAVLVGGCLAGAALVVGPMLLWLGNAGALRRVLGPGVPLQLRILRGVVAVPRSRRVRRRRGHDGVRNAVAAAGRLVRRRTAASREPAGRGGSSRHCYLCLVWLPIELALAAVPGRPYWHYFAPMLLPLASLVALCVSRGVRGRRAHAARSGIRPLAPTSGGGVLHCDRRRAGGARAIRGARRGTAQ